MEKTMDLNKNLSYSSFFSLFISKLTDKTKDFPLKGLINFLGSKSTPLLFLISFKINSSLLSISKIPLEINS